MTTPAPHPDARAEAGRRYPMHDRRVSVWHEMHQSGYWAFIAGAQWESERPAPIPEDRERLRAWVLDQMQEAMSADVDGHPMSNEYVAAELADALIAAGVTFR